MTDIVYYNLSLSAGQNTFFNNAGGEIANYLPIVDHPSEYYCSIIRLKTSQLSIPNGYFQVYIDPTTNTVTDVNKGIYQFQMKYGNYVASDYVYWITEYVNQTPPPTGTAKQTQSSYYFIFSYQNFINCWNNTLKNVYNALITAGAILPANCQPFFLYNPNNQTIELYSPLSVTNYDTAGTLRLYFNSYLGQYLTGFFFSGVQGNTLSSAFPFEMVMKPNPNNASFTSTTAPPFPNSNIVFIDVGGTSTAFIKVQQEYPNLFYWNCLSNIFVATNMNIIQESFNQLAGTQQGVNTIQQAIITDYIPDLTQGSGGAGVAGAVFTYNAPSLYRLFSFNQHTPLYNISASLYWTDTLGQTWPLEIIKNFGCDIKFAFYKKSLFSKMQLMNARF